MKIVHWIALILVIIGALNWGMWGIFQIDVVAALFRGASSGAARVIYTLVGLSGLWCLYHFKGLCSCSLCCSCKKDHHK
jgi:uncharacterized protein